MSRHTISVLDALRTAGGLMNTATIRGLKERVEIDPRVGNTVTGEWEHMFGVNARIHVGVLRNCDDDGFVANVEVSWSVKIYPPVVARAVVALHSDVVDLACLIEARLRDHKIVKEVKT